THGSANHTDVMKTEGLKQASKPYLFKACLSPSVFITSVCLALPWVKGPMFCSSPSGLVCTSNFSPKRSTVLSRKLIICLNFQLVSTCNKGKGGLPGAKAFMAK